MKLRTVEGQYGDLQVRKTCLCKVWVIILYQHATQPRSLSELHAGHRHPEDEASNCPDGYTEHQGQVERRPACCNSEYKPLIHTAVVAASPSE